MIERFGFFLLLRCLTFADDVAYPCGPASRGNLRKRYAMGLFTYSTGGLSRSFDGFLSFLTGVNARSEASRGFWEEDPLSFMTKRGSAKGRDS